MAFIAVLDQDRPDVLFKELDLVLGQFFGLCGEENREKQRGREGANQPGAKWKAASHVGRLRIGRERRRAMIGASVVWVGGTSNLFYRPGTRDSSQTRIFEGSDRIFGWHA